MSFLGSAHSRQGNSAAFNGPPGPSGQLSIFGQYGKKITSSVAGRGLNLLKLAGTSLRLARADEETVARNARSFLTESMGKMKGLSQKVGQILSMGESPEADDFNQLTESGEPLDFSVIEQVLNHEWKQTWREVLAHIEPEGHAASLGQVHRARLVSGEDVAGVLPAGPALWFVLSRCA